MTVQRIDSHIEDRARLVFVFPTPDKDVKRILPFFENVNVKESKTAKLIKYNPIGRSSNHFGYTGADSRKLSLSFNMTLPNIQSVATAGLNSNLGMRREENGVESLQEEFFRDYTGDDSKDLGGIRAKHSQKYEKRWYDILKNAGDPTDESQLLEFLDRKRTTGGLSIDLPIIDGSEERGALGRLLDGSITSLDGTLGDTIQYRMIDAIVYWTNLIRSSVLNNATNPFYGPPIVRLTYGVLYQDIPCVCQSYRISADDKAGYDQRTMLPRIIGVSMDLLEVREGDRGCFTPGTPIKRDNLTGWESIVGPTGTMDPTQAIPSPPAGSDPRGGPG